MNEGIQGRPGEQDLPQSEVSPHAHMYIYPPALLRAHMSCGPGGGCLLNQKESGGQRPHMGMVVRQVLVTWEPSGCLSFICSHKKLKQKFYRFTNTTYWTFCWSPVVYNAQFTFGQLADVLSGDFE